MTISNCRLFITPWVEGLKQAKPSQNDVTHISRHHHRALLVAGAQLRHHHHHHHEHNVLLSTKSLLAYFVDIIFASVIAPHLNFKFKNLAILIKKVADGKNKDMKLFVITILPQVYAKTRVNINKIHLSYNTGNPAFEEDDLKCFKKMFQL